MFVLLSDFIAVICVFAGTGALLYYLCYWHYALKEEKARHERFRRMLEET
jgi:hypothetical protein